MTINQNPQANPSHDMLDQVYVAIAIGGELQDYKMVLSQIIDKSATIAHIQDGEFETGHSLSLSTGQSRTIKNISETHRLYVFPHPGTTFAGGREFDVVWPGDRRIYYRPSANQLDGVIQDVTPFSRGPRPSLSTQYGDIHMLYDHVDLAPTWLTRKTNVWEDETTAVLDQIADNTLTITPDITGTTLSEINIYLEFDQNYAPAANSTINVNMITGLVAGMDVTLRLANTSGKDFAVSLDAGYNQANPALADGTTWGFNAVAIDPNNFPAGGPLPP